MSVYYLRIITESCRPEAEGQLIQALTSLSGIFDLQADPIRPYWKNPGQGEFTCSFKSSHLIEDLRCALAECWDTDVADCRRGTVHLPGALFLWLSN